MKLNLPHNFTYYSWLFANIALLGCIVFFIFSFQDNYSKKAKNVVAEGKRVIVSVPTGEVIARAVDKEEKDQAKQDADSALMKEIAGPVAPKEEEEEKVARVMVIVSGLGLNKKITEKALKLPREVLLSYSPYSHVLSEWFKRSVEMGHELLLDMPLETSDFPLTDPGPLSLFTYYSREKNLSQLAKVLTSAQGYVGLLTSIDEKFTFSLVSILPVLDVFKKHNLTLIYKERPSNGFVRSEAKSIDLAVVKDYMLVDRLLTKDAIVENFKKLEEKAKGEGIAVAVVRPFPLSLAILEGWLKSLKKKEILLTPLTTVLDKGLNNIEKKEKKKKDELEMLMDKI